MEGSLKVKFSIGLGLLRREQLGGSKKGAKKEVWALTRRGFREIKVVFPKGETYWGQNLTQANWGRLGVLIPSFRLKGVDF